MKVYFSLVTFICGIPYVCEGKVKSVETVANDKLCK